MEQTTKWTLVEHLISSKDERAKRREDLDPFWECHDCGQALYADAYKIRNTKKAYEIILGVTCVEKVTGLSIKELRGQDE